MRRRAPALPAMLLLLLLAPAAAAENLASIEGTTTEAPMVKPGEQAQFSLEVRYCYNAPPLAPTNVDVAFPKKPEWLTANANPSRFRADTGGQRCGAKEVVVQYTVDRAAPAFKPEAITMSLIAPGATREANAIVQVAYWAEVSATKPARVRVERGDQGTIQLEMAISANEATRIEITANDPERLVTLLAYYQGVPGVGSSLDNKVTQRIPLTVTVGPGAPVGVRPLTLNLTTHYDRLPTTLGASTTALAEIEVVEGAKTPFPGVALLAAGAVLAALLARRRAGPR